VKPQVSEIEKLRRRNQKARCVLA